MCTRACRGLIYWEKSADGPVWSVPWAHLHIQAVEPAMSPVIQPSTFYCSLLGRKGRRIWIFLSGGLAQGLPAGSEIFSIQLCYRATVGLGRVR
jgi:hypothetical protein